MFVLRFLLRFDASPVSHLFPYLFDHVNKVRVAVLNFVDNHFCVWKDVVEHLVGNVTSILCFHRNFCIVSLVFHMSSLLLVFLFCGFLCVIVGISLFEVVPIFYNWFLFLAMGV